MPVLPSGTVTFLFTDIEGSTKLWEQHPEAMRLALARHDNLLRQAIENNSGVVFKTMGDAFCAAFATAPDALSAALAAQVALHAEPWPDGLTLRVRMALHTGTAELRDNDYFGQPLNRVARLLAAGHGAQVLISAATQELTRDTLPAAAGLKDVGEHRLRDLGRPEQVFQLSHPALPTEFPPLKSLDNPQLPNNLPQQVTSFIGREKEIEAIKTLLGKTRLLTLTGSGGCGKTRLSLQVAADVLENYPDGAWLIELAPLADPALVTQSVAQAIGVIEEAGKPLVQTLVDFLKAKRLLLVLDNCEHVLDACSRLVDTLIRSCPNVKVFASSREGLGIAGETVYRIPSLSLPDLKQTATPASLSIYEAVRLFVDRAAAALPAFAVTNHNAPALAQLCVRLDGIPLALELSAARIRSLSVEEINSKLDNRFRLLTGGSRTALPRQQTLRALIDWSYDLLNDQEKTLLCHLCVFAGGWTLEAAEAVGVGETVEDWEVLDLLTSLVDKSLVVAEAEQGQTRYRLLETVRQYARDRLAESGEAESVWEGHRNHFLAWAEEEAPKLTGAEQAFWLEALETEHDNLRQALAYCLEAAEGGEAGLRMGAALWRFWYIRGHYGEGRAYLAAALERAVRSEKQWQTRARTLNGAGNLAYGQGDYVAARALYEESQTIFRELGDKLGIAYSLNNLGNLAYVQGDYVAAHALTEECLTIRRELGDRNGIAYSLVNLGSVATDQSDYVAARALTEECLTIFRELGKKDGIANSLNNLGNLAHLQGDYAASRALTEESLTIRRELGDRNGIATSLNDLGMVALGQGDHVAARALLEESLTIRRELGNKSGIAESLDAFAQLARLEQQERHAAPLWGAATVLREVLSAPLPPSEREKQEREMAGVREILGEDAFAAGWAQGQAMTMEQAIEYAIEDVGK